MGMCMQQRTEENKSRAPKRRETRGISLPDKPGEVVTDVMKVPAGGSEIQP